MRKPLLEAEDVTYMKAMEADDASAKTASVAKKKALRDAPSAKAIDDADTIAKLKALGIQAHWVTALTHEVNKWL